LTDGFDRCRPFGGRDHRSRRAASCVALQLLRPVNRLDYPLGSAVPSFGHGSRGLTQRLRRARGTFLERSGDRIGSLPRSAAAAITAAIARITTTEAASSLTATARSA
jgi:hypothetical protein